MGYDNLTKGETTRLKPFMRWSKSVADGVTIVFMYNGWVVVTGTAYEWGTLIGHVADDKNMPAISKKNPKFAGVGQIHFYYRENDESDLITEGDFNSIEEAAIALAKKCGYLA